MSDVQLLCGGVRGVFVGHRSGKTNRRLRASVCKRTRTQTLFEYPRGKPLKAMLLKEYVGDQRS